MALAAITASHQISCSHGSNMQTLAQASLATFHTDLLPHTPSQFNRATCQSCAEQAEAHCRIAGPLTCDSGGAAADGGWPAGHAPRPAWEANAMDRLPAPKHRRVEADGNVSIQHLPWEDEPMEEVAEGRLPAGDRFPAPHSRHAPSNVPAPRPPWEDEPMGEGAGDHPTGSGRTPAPPPTPAPNNAVRRVERLDKEQQDQEDFSATKEGLETPTPRTQMDQSGAVPRPAWDDRYRDELYSPIYATADLQYRLFPSISRPLPGSDQEPTGLTDRENYQAADTYATGETSWIPDYPQSHRSQMVDYDCLEGWLSTHLPAPGSIEALVIFTDTRPLDQIGAWRHTQRLWQHRFSRMGPHHERWQGLFVPLTADTGLADVHCTWKPLLP